MTNLQRLIKYGAIFLAFSIIIGTGIALISGVNILFNMFYSTSPKLTDGKKIEITNNITNIEIDLKATNLIIERDKKLSASTNNEKIDYRIRGNTLIITEKGNKYFTKDITEDLVIYIPDDHKLEEISLDAGAGSVEFYDIKVDELDLNLGAGKVELDFVEVRREASIEGGAGNLVITNSEINNLELDMGIGTLELESKLFGENEISCGVGSSIINLIGNDYQITVNKGLGKATISGENVKDGETIGNSRNTLEIDGGVGSIAIELMEELLVYPQ